MLLRRQQELQAGSSGSLNSTVNKLPLALVNSNRLAVTYSPLTNISSHDGMNYGQTIQPDVSTFEGDPAINVRSFDDTPDKSPC